MVGNIMPVKSLLFTKEMLQEIKAPEAKRDIYKDTKEKGLLLIVSYGGSKIFYLGVVLSKKYHRIKIGVFPYLSIIDARLKASELKGKIAQGYNPIEEKARLSKEPTFKEFYDRYLDEYSKINNKRWKDYADSVDRYAKHLYPRKISTIQKTDIQELFNNLTKTGKYGANRFLEVLSPVFSKAIEWELLTINPVIGIKKHKEQSRDRYLTREEIPRFFTAIADEQNQVMQDFFLIALYTSVRKDNLLTMKWEQVSFTDKQLYLPETKNGDPHRLPLLDQAVEILKARKEQSTSMWVFPSETSSSGHLQEPKKAWKRICKKAGIENLRIHDLRRTIPSWMAMTGANQYVIGQLLNHRDPRSTAVYTRLANDTAREYMQRAVSTIINIKS
ncbi:MULTISPECIES: tyrosine-type recombinase/integrase [spotted fever group]|uniref:tyrosine-type recombinase/integrase n=2 Tax=Rickettsia TaxID=780 RepID=UPI0001A60638|nr:site-specific integrase [Rickettsia endosymbiont of Ixodes scapularis]EER21733.1 integrase [Rickettsia endosymbiont of Ixodes scapularis]